MSGLIHALMSGAKGLKDHLWTEHGEITMQPVGGVMWKDPNREPSVVPLDSMLNLTGDPDVGKLMRLGVKVLNKDRESEIQAVWLVVDAECETRDGPLPGSTSDRFVSTISTTPEEAPSEEDFYIGRRCLLITLYQDDLVGGVEVSLGEHFYHLAEGGQLAWEGEASASTPQPPGEEDAVAANIIKLFKEFNQ